MDEDDRRKGGKGRSGPGSTRAGSGGARSGGPKALRKPFVRRQDAGESATGERKPRFDGDARPTGDRPRKPYVKRQDAGEGATGERKPRFDRDARSAGDRPRKPYVKRQDTGEGATGERKPRFDRDARPAGDRPRKPYVKRQGAGEGATSERKPRFDRDDRSSGERPRKPFVRRSGDDAAASPGEGRGSRPFRPRDGERRGTSFADSGSASRRPRAERDGKPSDRSDKPRREGRADRRPAQASAEPGEAIASERIAKRLARAGIASRRDAEALVEDGRIAVNGKVLTSPATNVSPSDRITIDGQPIPEIERTRLFLFHKPAGLVTTNRDPEGRPTVFDALPADLPRLITIGRLDINTEGLLLLTNDGGLARLLELPATGWLRRYRVRVHGQVDEQRLASLREGVAVDGVFYGAVEATLDREQGSNAWLTIGLREGKNREVKNILASLGLDVTRLIRVSYGPFQLGELAEGAVQEIKGRMLREQLGDRLIEEAGANFDAPIVTPFSNRPTVAPREERRPERRAASVEPGEGGLIKNRKRDREDRRESALGRLQTTRPARSGPGGRKREDREEKVHQPPRGRASNVWMAPGARPQGKKKPVEEADEGGERPRRAKRPDGGARKGPGEGAAPKGPRKPRRGE